MAKENKALNRLLGMFGLALKGQNTQGNSTIVYPGKVKDNSKKEDPNVVPIDFPSDIQKSLEYFLANYDFSSNLERFNRYSSLEFMCRSMGIMGNAALIYTAETFETKDGVRPIQIKAKDRKVEKVFYNWLQSIGFNNNILQELAWDLTVFGDAFWMNAVDMQKGVIGISIINPYLVKEKLEFSLNSLGQTRNWRGLINTLTSRYEILSSIADMIEHPDQYDYSLCYQPYLLGYQLRSSVAQDSDTQAHPPWAITHFRHYSTGSEFFPFGRPLFINSLARYKSCVTTEMLIDMLRVASFPKEKITVKGGENLSPLDRRIKLNEVKQMIENMSPKTNSKDNLTIGDRIYDMDGLYEYNIIDPGVDIDKLGDLEMKQNDLILTTGIPDSYLIPSRGAGLGGENASALFYNNKIFQRRVVGNKSAILEGITSTFRMHLGLIEEFDGYETEFELFMPVNADMYSSDKMSFESDMLKLATEMMDGLGQSLGMERGESLPEPVVRDIFKHYLPIDDEVVDKWINMIVKQHEENEIENPNAEPKEPAPLIIRNEQTQKFVESYKKGEQDITLRELYFKTKAELGMNNGLLGDKVYYNDTLLIKENANKPGKDKTVFSLLTKMKINNKLQEVKNKKNKK